MRDSLKRALRTFVQGAIGVAALIAIPWLNDLIQTVSSGGEVDVDVNVLQGIVIACAAGGVIALISFVQNWLEDKTGKNALPK